MVKKSAGKAAPAPAVKATKANKKAAVPIAKAPKKAAKQDTESESEGDSSAAEEEEDSDAEAQEDKEASSETGRTMEEKLQDMNSKSTASTSHSTTTTPALSSTSSRTTTSTSTTTTSSKHTTPKAADLQQTFIQALHTSDTALLNACLHYSTPLTPLRDTVRRIATIYVTPLLTSLLTQFQQKPNQNTHLIEWIKAILLIHSSFLMNNVEIVQRLSNFYRAVDARVPVYQKVMNLNGRLDLIMNQIEMRKLYEASQNGEDEEPVFVEDEEQVEEEDLDHTGGMDDDEDDDDLVGEADAFDEDENGDTDEEELESDMSEDDDDVSDDEE
ncbi:MAG: hypothetical protein J3R72DRAFT_454909 [Linnemannia gamsii]|nr:MAG: hypothetical protein J3R72DRAFT_454909 [Linnemannia gamsii]